MKKGNNRRFLSASVGLLMLISLVLIACGGNQTTSSPTPTVTPTPAPTSVVITSSIVGAYTVTITQSDIPEGSLALPGHWKITFEKDGLYAVFLEGLPHSVATYTVKQNQVTIMNDVTCIDFGQSEGTPGISTGTGTYTWTLNGKILTLKAVSDPCSPRKLIFSTHTWVEEN